MTYMTEPSLFETVDTLILTAVNTCHSHELDIIMWWLSDRWIWVPFYIFLAGCVVRRFGAPKGIAIILATLVLIAFTDHICASIIRPAVERLRPSNPDNPISATLHLVNDYRGGRYGFPSCHAANTFALAVFISLFFRNRYVWAAMTGWSLLVSYSRVYLGVHYPGDILGGVLIGASFASIWYLPWRYVVMRQCQFSTQRAHD